jgi:hypothetical protein
MRQRLHRDEGQVLGLALVFLVFVALVLAATLTAAASSLHATQASTQQRDERYAADAAVLAAAASMQGDVSKGADRGTATECDIDLSKFVVGAPNPMQTTVACDPSKGSGAGDGDSDPSHAAPNRPSYAILALPSDPGEGVVNDGGNPVKVFGPVHSNGGVCELPGCETTSAPDPGTVEPEKYAPWSATAPAPAPQPTCPPDSDEATFYPGTYNEVPAIPPGCHATTWWFQPAQPFDANQPGIYYFDFTSGKHSWDIPNGVTIVGGTPDQTSGLCKTDSPLPPNAGVQFVFGGDSRINVKKGATVNVCAQPTTARQQIAVYGMMTNAGSVQQLTLSPTIPGSTTAPAYEDLPNAASINGTYAHVSIPASGSASIDLSGFAPLTPESIVEQAELKVVHHEDPAIQSLALAVRGSGPAKSFTSDPACDSSHLCISPGDASDPTLRTDAFDITSLVLADPTLASLSVTFTATGPSVGGPYDSFVDGVELDLTLAPSAGGYRALAGCANRVTTDGGCPLISTEQGATLQVNGTVYAPTALVDVADTSDQVGFNLGLIARSVLFHAPPEPASVITAGGGFDRVVTLEASVNGHRRLVTSVEFSDAQAFLDGTPPKITYKYWDIK